MAGLDPATQQARLRAPSFAAQARREWMGGSATAHGELLKLNTS
jgi:hypothetical protein